MAATATSTTETIAATTVTADPATATTATALLEVERLSTDLKTIVLTETKSDCKPGQAIDIDNKTSTKTVDFSISPDLIRAPVSVSSAFVKKTKVHIEETI